MGESTSLLVRWLVIGALGGERDVQGVGVFLWKDGQRKQQRSWLLVLPLERKEKVSEARFMKTKVEEVKSSNKTDTI